MGSLLEGQRDAGGLMYMRNRYYDPATGQFTQTDPIGIAGGLNTYGFAAGDPVTYSDPYGLKVCAKSRSMRRHIENTYQVTVEWDDDGCVDSSDKVHAREGSERYLELQDQFGAAVDHSRTTRVVWSNFFDRLVMGGSNATCSAQVLNSCRIAIDRGQSRRSYGIDTPRGCGLAGPWSIGPLIAHEFGHVFNFLGGGSVEDQRPAIYSENLFNTAFGGRHARSYSCPP
jgi:RHS repeat-associated protein